MARDHYEVLGISRAATQAEIRQAFRQKARELHPDVNPAPDATRQFQELNAAYHVLNDPVRRSVFDRLSAAAYPYGRPPSPPRYPAPTSPIPPRPSATWDTSGGPSTTYWRSRQQASTRRSTEPRGPLPFKVWLARMILALFDRAVGLSGSLLMLFLAMGIPCIQTSILYGYAQNNHIQWLLDGGNAFWTAIALETLEAIAIVAIGWGLYQLRLTYSRRRAGSSEDRD